MKRFFKKLFSDPDRRVAPHPIRVEALLVEDKDDEAVFFEGLLRHQNVVVTRTKSLAETLSKLSEFIPYQIAFVDLTLPDGSGFEVIRRIKESRRMTHVIVVSGDIGKIPLAASYGYIGVLTKPYNVDAIGEILWKHRLPCAY
jgi:CheY-like chemotaxis protein